MDIVAAAGGGKKALIVKVQAAATKGVISIELVSVINNPMINGLELVYSGDAPSVPPPLAPPPTASPVVKTGLDDILINCGGVEILEASGLRTWKADQFFTGGKTFNSGNKDILKTEDDL